MRIELRPQLIAVGSFITKRKWVSYSDPTYMGYPLGEAGKAREPGSPSLETLSRSILAASTHFAPTVL